jgi:hypothetical protein
VTRRRELVLAAAGALLVLVAGALLLVRPKQQATVMARADHDAAVAESQALRDQIKALEALRPREADLRTRAGLSKAAFPATPALPGLIDALQDAASLAGVELGTLAPTTPKASSVSPELAEISASVRVKGSFFEVEDFLVRLENLVKGTDPDRVPPRSVLVSSVDLSSGSEGGTGDSAAATPAASGSPSELEGNIVLLMFQSVRPAGTPSTPAPPAATASQGAQVR